MINKKSYTQIIKLLSIIYEEKTPRDAFVKAEKKFGENFVSAFFFSKEIKGYIDYLKNPERLTLTEEGLKEIQRYKKEKQQQDFNNILALTGSVLALIGIFNFLRNIVPNNWLIIMTWIFTILVILCFVPIVNFAWKSFWKRR